MRRVNRISRESCRQNAKRLLRFLKKTNKSISPLLILTHDFPDPDALGSAFALQYIVEHIFGISSKIVYRGDITRVENRAMVKKLKIHAQKLHPDDFSRYQHIAIVDSQPEFGNNPFPKKRQATIVIDQHAPIQKPSARLSIINTGAGATSVILGQALLHLKIKIPPVLATALVYGILSDTLNLYRSNQEEVLRTYLQLLSFSDLRILSDIQNPTRSKSLYTTIMKGLRNAKVCKKLIVSHLGAIDSPELVSQVADFLIPYHRMAWCFCTGRHKDRLYVSLRIAKGRRNAGTILRSIFDNTDQAGGHGTIAGGSLKVKHHPKENHWIAAQDKLVARLIKRLRIPANGEFYHPFQG
ncbi:hypothetical protein BVX98_07455 [bacterium F11]|nr:hypothetical protein BVX98_07455 [bacterium F11]